MADELSLELLELLRKNEVEDKAGFLAKELDEQVAEFRDRPHGSYSYLWLDARSRRSVRVDVCARWH